MATLRQGPMDWAYDCKPTAPEFAWLLQLIYKAVK